jgi:hypothetical protein
VAKSPLAARRDAQAFWLDGKVIVLGGEPAVQSQDQYLYTDMASYDPGANAWKKLAPLPATKNHQVLLVVAVATGNRLYAWQGWVQSEPTADGTTTYYGIELDIYDPQSNNWTVDHAASRGSGNTNNDSPDSLVGAVWTGSSIITPASQLFCGMCPGPYANGLQSRMLDVATNTWTKLPHGPTDDLMPTSLWTGGALLSFNTTTTTSGPGGNHLPGEAAAFDPASDRWTSLPSAPLAGDVVAVWAGGRLLEWGSMSVPSNAEAGAAPAARTAGLSFGP